MAAMRVPQPKMKALQERHKDDRAKLQEEMLKLYKEEGANPMAGCLPILLQIPIFYALYKVLLLAVEMRHQPFVLWIRDLAAPDPLTPVNLFGFLPFQPPAMLAIGVLPILLGITMWLQMRLNPPATDPVQKQVFALMPWVLMVIMSSFAAGLQLYWVTNNILTIAQQRLLYARYPGMKASSGRGRQRRPRARRRRRRHRHRPPRATAETAAAGAVSADDQQAELARKLFSGPVSFLKSAPQLQFLPDPNVPEIAFAGRSNVGKSSLLNRLTGRSALARTSNTPGRTQELNFFEVGEPVRLRLVDMPGYGFAKAPKDVARKWRYLINDYLRGRAVLKRALVLVDSRHGLKDVDRDVMKMLDEAAVGYALVLTKADKVKASGSPRSRRAPPRRPPPSRGVSRPDRHLGRNRAGDGKATRGGDRGGADLSTCRRGFDEVRTDQCPATGRIEFIGLLKLIIGNKAYSSWSLRGWLAVKQSGLPFEEITVPMFDENGTSGPRATSSRRRAARCRSCGTTRP